MNDFGGKLRQAREGRGMSVRQMATATKISVTTLEALERNDISKLPGGIFSRSFVRSYAVEVGLDPDATVNDYLDRCQGEPPPPVPVVQIPEEELAFERRKQQAARVFLVALAAMIIVAAVVVYLILKNRPVTATPHELGTAVIPLTLRTS
ncbi:MAG: helix-turn-helix domain-containing protein [Acidobacteria bacterium]|nr:helix-turn-helix domain-containing protein [Acidobacteriota bacterium]